jgi:hypothetical protein
MNLIHSNSSTVHTPLAESLGTRIELDSNATDRPKIRLRGSIFFYTPRPILIAEAVETDGATVPLIYRGNTYQRKLKTPKSYRKPRAINWRWQVE